MRYSRVAVLLATCLGTLAFGAGAPALAHTQTVSPPAHEEPVVTGPISNPWARAHCESAAPGVVDTASDGVVSFMPVEALCNAVVNPGGQVHP